MSEFKSIQEQKHIWGTILKNSKTEDDYSYQWGDPTDENAKNKSGDILGNYSKILSDYLYPFIVDKEIVDLGSFDGKWIPFFSNAKKIICADITEESFEFIKNKYPSYPTEFYLTDGIGLKGLFDKSIDFIFSMDSLVRSEQEVLEAYIQEFKRVLKDDGRACIHLPCSEQTLSYELGFTSIRKNDIVAVCKEAGFTDFYIDSEIINHGVLLLIGYGVI